MDTAAFDHLDEALTAGPPGAALDALAERLAAAADYRALLDALLLRARLDLGLPLARPGSLADLPEPARTAYEDRYVAAITRVGTLILDAGELGAAWSYFRAIGEKGPIYEAIDRFVPDPDDHERLDEVIDVALGQGVHPARGFDLVLDRHGTCSALSAFESLPPDEAIRRRAEVRLVDRLHADLLVNLGADLARRGLDPLPPDVDLAAWLVGRDELFEDDAYHLDVSHLAMIVRLSPLLTDPEPIQRAVALAEYGRRLSPRLGGEPEPPFDDFYADHARYLRALLGDDPDGAVALFRSRLAEPDPANCEAPHRAQTLVRLLDRLGRPGEAFDVAAAHLARVPDGALGEPTLAQLGLKLGRADQLADLARAADDPVKYAAFRLEASGAVGPPIPN